MENDVKLITVGRIAKPHGIRGELKVVVPGISVDRLADLKRVRLLSGQQSSWYEVIKVRFQPAGLILDLSGIDDRNRAEELRGFEVQVDKDEIPLSNGDQFDPLDLEGFIVETVNGQRVGVLTEYMKSAGQDILVIDRDGSEVLIPAVEPLIKNIDLSEELIIIDPVDGLLDINEN